MDWKCVGHYKSDDKSPHPIELSVDGDRRKTFLIPDGSILKIHRMSIFSEDAIPMVKIYDKTRVVESVTSFSGYKLTLETDRPEETAIFTIKSEMVIRVALNKRDAEMNLSLEGYLVTSD